MASASDHHRDGLVGVVIRDFPLPLKRKLIKIAKADGTTVQDIVVKALADAFGVKYVLRKRKTTGLGDSTSMYFGMPRVLRRKINQEAARLERPSRTIILNLLNEKFGKKR